MPKKEHDWHIGDDPPRIKLHSLAKHRVYEEYLIHYIQVLNANPRIPGFSLTLIDGFAGGGVYLDPQDNSHYPGSPLRLIRAAEAAGAAVNTKRQQEGVRTPFELRVEYFFIEKERSNYEYLTKYLSEKGLEPRFNKDIFLLHGKFTERITEIIKYIINSRKNQRCIFFLDQYGYKDVPFDVIRTIFSELPNAEIILTFATDWLINYMSDRDEYRKALQKIGIDQELGIDDLLENKIDNENWRRISQLRLHSAIASKTGAKYYTPFFIVSEKANRSFWLVHLSSHPRARDVMTQLHWRLKNHFTHYGRAGIWMFGYDPVKDKKVIGMDDLFGETEYSFDEHAEGKTMESMVLQLPELIHEFSDGVRFSDLYRRIANTTPATSEHIKEAVGLLFKGKELEILGPKGERRRKASRIADGDILRLHPQETFLPIRSDFSYLKHRKN